MATTFPKNPTEGMIFEAIPGLFYQFSARENCWIRVDGLEALGLATPTKDGLMSSEDYNKLNELLIPPPQSTIKGGKCNVPYTKGKVELTSLDESLFVSPSLQLTNNAGQAGIIDEPWGLHRNTAGYNFRLNVEKLLETMRANGNFTQVKIQGRQGPRGKPGADGINQLQTGPQGATGPSGKNSPFNGTIGSDPNSFVLADANSNRAIVDLTADPLTNTLVATRANIGNPNACPTEVAPKAITSPFVLVLSKQENALLRTLQSTNDCNNPCTVCVSTLYYVNLELILDSFFERFVELAGELKAAKEQLAISWLRTLITVFTDQKFSLCCALENCKSAQRNKQERQYIESQRIAAAGADQQLIIDGVNDRQVVDMNADKSCPVEPAVTQVRRGVGCDCVLQYTLDGKLHATDPRGKFLARPPALVDFQMFDPSLQTGRVGILDVHTEMQRPQLGDRAASGDDVIATRTIIIQTGLQAPPQAASVSAQDWKLTIDGVSTINNPVRAGLSGYTLTASINQNGTTIASYEYTSVLDADFTPTKLTLLPKSGNFGAANTTTPLEVILVLTVGTHFPVTDASSFYAVDWTLGAINLVGSATGFKVNVELQADWSFDNWTCDGVGIDTGNGFVSVTLPPGEYLAEIVDCCVDVINTRNLWRGVAAIEFNKPGEVTAALGTVETDFNSSERTTIMFPDMGSFSNNADARTSYLGSTITFTHQGGQIRSWIVDPDSDPTNNDGQMVVCIKPLRCAESGTGSVPVDSNAVFVYRNEIGPLNLLGILFPFEGTLSAKDNYGYGNVTAEAYAPRDATHLGPEHGFNITKSFFYHGPDGLSFYTINGGSGTTTQNFIKMAFGVGGNSIPTLLKVADEPAEVTQTKQLPDEYNAGWKVGTFGSDGLAFGPLDPPSDGAGWQIIATPNDLAAEQYWTAVSADGNSFTLAFDGAGIGTKNKDGIIFSPIRTGCVMPFKQIQWLERGHRIGAACSCVVTIDSVEYIIVKRSIGTDTTCGGGESLSNPCIAQYLATGGGHPAIAWPTANGQEFLGIPTSGAHGFVLDQTFSDKVIAEIKAGHMTNIHGDPAANIPFVLAPTSM